MKVYAVPYLKCELPKQKVTEANPLPSAYLWHAIS
jgi:hypothetical protein